MKRTVLLAGFLLVSHQVALAQVEPRIAGDWRDDQGRTWHIGSDGRFQASANGQVVESGRITANEGCLKMQSDSGRTEEGRFSVIGGKLQLHGGNLSGSWTKGPASMSSSSQSQSNPVSPALTVAKSSDDSGSRSSTPGKTLSGSASVSGRPVSTQETYAAKYGSSSPSKGSSAQFESKSKSASASTEDNRRMISDEQRIIEAVSKRNNHFSYDSATTTQRVNQQQTSPAQVPAARNYSDAFKTDRRALPGLEPATADKGAAPNNTNSAKRPKTTIADFVKKKYSEGGSGDRSYYNQLMSEQHSSTPHSQGPRAVPKGGYIHVMKDTRARNYFQGR